MFGGPHGGPPPAYSTPTSNPDRRPLPDGYITRYDDNYRAWYYVDTHAHPPRSSWDHPSGPLPSASHANFAQPSNQPSSRTGFPGPGRGSQYGQPQQTTPYTSPQQFPPASFPHGYQPTSQEQHGSYPQSPSYQQPHFGTPAGYSTHPQGWPQQQNWQHPQPPPTQTHHGFNAPAPSQAIQQPPRSNNTRNALLAGGAGLVGGVVLAEAFENHEDEVREDAYDQGFVDGQDNADYGGDW